MDPARHGLHEPRSRRGADRLLFDRLYNPPQNGQIEGPGAARGIEHHNVRVGEPQRQTQLLAQRTVDSFDHIMHHLSRRVPDPELAPEIGVKGLKKRLIEVLHRLLFREALKKGLAVDAVQRPLREIEPLPQRAGERRARPRHRMKQTREQRQM